MRDFGLISKIHFVGVGGAGMSGLAEILNNLGFDVSGSDLKAGATAARLAAMGVRVCEGHAAENVGDAGVVVVSTAIPADNPEVVEARRRGIPVIPRAEMLAELMRLKRGIAVCGTHGKTTTTSILATLLAEGGLEPTFVVGGRVNRAGTGAKLGEGEYFVAEADESDGSFLRLSPIYAICTNVDEDHLDYYGDFGRVKDAFVEFLNKVPFYGLNLVCGDDPGVVDILDQVSKPAMTYGVGADSDVVVSDIASEGLKTSFNMTVKGEPLGRLTINLPGEHSALNAAAAAAMALVAGVEFNVIQKALDEFEGVEMRFQRLGEVEGPVTIMHDYAHHPREIETMLAALRRAYPGRRLVAVFQPHRYSRTKDQMKKFPKALAGADLVVVTGIYPAGEVAIAGVTEEGIVAGLLSMGHAGVHHVPDKADIPERVAALMAPGDVIVHVGAGDVWKVAEDVLRYLAH
ncbi:MAG: UDP-N-acetylmuramate--L-alanine ligase [Candidatus Zixiibacteriota bacterium]